MKLELKHLVPYLPYGLMLMQDCSSWHEPEEDRPVLFTGILDKDEAMAKRYDFAINHLINIWYQVNDNISGNDTLSRFKPILRPLSDLDKKISVKGVAFFPKDFFTENEIRNYEMTLDTPMYETLFDLCSFGLVSKLIEWHFDVFDLIPRGLAIDINTVKK